MKIIKAPKKLPKWSYFLLIYGIAALILTGGYWLYKQSIEKAVYSTTLSFMEQLIEHDATNIENQIITKLNYVQSLTDRLRLSSSNEMGEISYLLGIEAQATHFDKLFLVTTDKQVYDNSYLVTNLDQLNWKEIYEAAEGSFVSRYSIDLREKWGDYLLYGIRLETPVPYGTEMVEGLVGMISVEEVQSLMQYQSFDGKGTAMVIQKDGAIITSSQYYDSEKNQNYFRELEESKISNHTDQEWYKKCILNEEALFLDYTFENTHYYATFKPLDTSQDTGWYMVVKVPAEVMEEQTQELLLRSLAFFFLLGLVIVMISFFVYRTVKEAEVAKASEQSKSSFLANMSHEIRTPLNGITGLLYLMSQNLDNKEKLTQYLKKAEVSAEFLKSVITDVLDMSKIESGQMELDQKPIHFPDILKEIQMLIEPQAEERKLHFILDYKEIQSPYVCGDPVRIKQIIVNLLGNALKFTPAGGTISLKAEQTDGTNTILTISDTGCGMSQEFLEKIWKPFEQERRLGSQNGTGLGTTLSKILTEKMGGSIQVESLEGTGTTFTVSIPFPVMEPPVDSVQPEQTIQKNTVVFNGKRILVVEDNEINRSIVKEILSDKGMEVSEACNGQEAVDLFEQSPSDYYFAILMDVQMPVLDGYGATAKIRSLQRKDSKTVPILALTANAFQSDLAKALECGMDDVITKPLNLTLLLEKLSLLQKKEKE